MWWASAIFLIALLSQNVAAVLGNVEQVAGDIVNVSALLTDIVYVFSQISTPFL
jgi:uncharacterized membrane protein